MSDSEDFEYSDEDVEMDQEETTGESVTIENLFTEAEDLRRSDPSKAISMFEQIVELTISAEGQNSWKFKTLSQLTTLHLIGGDVDKATEYYVKLLSNKDCVSKGESSSTIDSILELAQEKLGDEPEALMKLYEKTNMALDKDADERLWFNINIRFGRMLLARRNLERLNSLLQTMLPKLSKSTSAKFETENYVLDLYMLELNFYEVLGEKEKLKSCYQKMENIASETAVQDPRLMATLKEVGAKIDMESEHWGLAYDKFFEAFRHYQEAGNIRSKQILKYVVLANMIALRDINPFSSQEAKAYKDDEELQEMINLKSAFDTVDIVAFEKILNHGKSGIRNDEYMMNYIHPLLKKIRKKTLLIELKPFEKISLSFVSKLLNGADVEIVQGILCELIASKELKGEIDQEAHLLIIEKENPQTRLKHIQAEKIGLMQGIATNLEGILKSLEDCKKQFTSRRERVDRNDFMDFFEGMDQHNVL